MCEKFKELQLAFVELVEEQMSHLNCVNTKEMGEVIDIIKDLEECIYYHTISESMKHKEEGDV